MDIAIVGLPASGKTTIFNAMTAAGAEISEHGFSTLEAESAVVEVPDARLCRLQALLTPSDCISTSIQITDIAGLVRGASKGEGRGNQFLGDVRSADALLHVVRCFADQSVAHVANVGDRLCGRRL